MTGFTETAYNVFAPTDAGGNPRRVDNADTQRWGTEVERLIMALVAGQGGDIDLPNLLIRYTVTGGTANAIIATPNLPVPSGPGLALFSIQILQPNTGPVTINGKPLRDNDGSEIAPGGLPPGMWLFLDAGDAFILLQGPRGWSPLLRVVTDGARRVLELYDWTGGHGAKPTIRGYLGPDGITPNIADATDIRGPEGPNGPGTGDMLRSVYDPGEIEGNVFNGFPVATRTALKSLNPSIFTSAYLTEPYRQGRFVWRAGDYSAQVAADTLEGIFIKADAVAASSGAWVREYGSEILADWFGPTSDPAETAYLNPNFDINSIPTVEKWDFNDGTVQGWTALNGTPSNVSGNLRITGDGNTLPAAISPTFSRRGAAGDKVIVRLKKVSGSFTTTSGLRLFWSAVYPEYPASTAHAFSSSYVAAPTMAAKYTINANEYYVFVFDMAKATGGWDWIANLVTGLRLDLTTATDAVVDIDYVGVASALDFGPAINGAIRAAASLNVARVVPPRRRNYRISESIRPLDGLNIQAARENRIVVDSANAIEISAAAGNVPLRNTRMAGFHFVNGRGKDYAQSIGFKADAHRNCVFEDFYFSSYDSSTIAVINPVVSMAANPKAKPEAQNVLFNKYSHWYVDLCRVGLDIYGGAAPGPVTNLITHNLWEDLTFRWVSLYGINSRRWHDNDQFTNIFIGLNANGAAAVRLSEHATDYVGVSAHHFDGLTLVRDNSVSYTSLYGIVLYNAPRMVFANVRSDNGWPVPGNYIQNFLGVQMKFSSSFAHADWGELDPSANMVDVTNISASEKSGQVTATAGSTSLAVSFQLWNTPTEYGVTPLANPGAHTWITSVSRTGMTLNFSAPLPSDTVFRWWAKSRVLQ